MKTCLYNNFIINPSLEVKPSIRISPFIDSDLSFPEKGMEAARKYLSCRFNNYLLTTKARDAINLALSYYQLAKDDIVTILTTSNNYYISSCVTKEIEKHCLWSREISSQTKLIFVNHEFGYPFDDLNVLKQYCLPIIEDCAHAFVSEDGYSQIGKVGDFVIYSLPKFFPMQIGGVLVSNKLDLSSLNNDVSLDSQKYILNHLSANIPFMNDIIRKRLYNYMYLSEKLSNLGISPFFSLKDKVIPGVFLFNWNDSIDYSKLKAFMQYNGVESSVFYGKNAFFIPVHHRLENFHLDYVVSLLEYFKNDYCKH